MFSVPIYQVRKLREDVLLKSPMVKGLVCEGAKRDSHGCLPRWALALFCSAIQDSIIILDEAVVLSPGEYAQELLLVYLFVYAKNDQNVVLIIAFVNLYDIN